MRRFKPGQEVVCITEGDWESRIVESWFFFTRTKWIPQIGPKRGDVVTVRAVAEVGTHISFMEFPEDLFYPEVAFEPLPEITEIHEHLNAVANPVEYVGRRCPCGCGMIIALSIV